MNDNLNPVALPSCCTGRGFLYLGMLIALAGVGIFAVQFNAGILKTPWYMPMLATVGAVLIFISLKQSRSLARWIAFALFVAFAGFQWFAFLVLMKLPAYVGPAQVGRAFPHFAATFADGTPFTFENLKGDKNTILLFFRGRW